MATYCAQRATAGLIVTEGVAPSAVGLPGAMWTDSEVLQPYPEPEAMTEADIEQALADVAEAAANADRIRFALEVAGRVGARIGASRVGMRLSPYDAAGAAADLAAGRGDLVAFGRAFLANPDPSTFYTPGEKGYTD